ncbi:efflux RND transporter periplasmic adaptor subunit [Ignavigranum ruoffiae]|uniref:efflux RND transporter periplasmic adaptor subunit n=1 Tax=Ignavigranum ruoffiae TaxID=89093 RepID=UPI0023547613|nr:biotin/lipoyl-binding protein [Ignavigranum ruoffiae]
MSTKRTSIVVAAIIVLMVGIVWFSNLFIPVSQDRVGAQLGDPSMDPAMMNQAPLTDEEGNEFYYYEMMTPQEPISLKGEVQLATDQSYFYNPELGDINNIKVKDGQKVKKGQVLFTYQAADKEIIYQMEDAQRKQTRLYNAREDLIDQLSQLTGNIYNYQGDWIDYNGWDEKGGYYILEEIGQAQDYPMNENNEAAAQMPSMDEAMMMDDFEGQVEGIKEQIRQLNREIEDIEIEIGRLNEKSQTQVKAKVNGKVILNQDGKDNAQIPLVRIISEDISITGTASEYEFYLLKEDIPVDIYINAEDREIPGTLVAYDQYPQSFAPSKEDPAGLSAGFSPAPGSQTGSQYGYTVQADEFIQPGFSVKVKIKSPGFMISPSALVEEQGKTYVFVYDQGIARKTEVKTERESGNVVIHRGVNEGDQVLLAGSLLTDGQEVKTIDEMTAGQDGNE